MSQKREVLSWIVDGMSCSSCEQKIEQGLLKIKGVEQVSARYRTGKVKVSYDAHEVKPDSIERAIAQLGYTVREGRQEKPSMPAAVRGILIAASLLLLYVLGSRFGLFAFFNAFPQAEQGMGLGMLFVIGLLTSVHCVAMCGGINLSQCLGGAAGGGKFAGFRPSLLYNLGRVISYTFVGFLVGALGSVIKFSLTAQAVVQLLAGAFMIIMGLNLMNAFPWLRRLMPSMPRFLSRRIAGERARSGSALYVGLLNGLMPCGPLQAMQLYALSTGSPVKGALAMLMFSLGTVPMMFGLGALSSVLSRRFAGRMMAAGAALVAVMGVAMLGNGLGLAGISLPMGGAPDPVASASTIPETSSQAEQPDGSTGQQEIQTVSTELSPYGYEPITVQAGIPVRWTIHAESSALNGCNNALVIREYGIQQKLSPGDNVIEFTPEESGTFTYTCWMGMIRSTITVQDAPVDQAAQSSMYLQTSAPVDVDSLPVASCCQ